MIVWDHVWGITPDEPSGKCDDQKVCVRTHVSVPNIIVMHANRSHPIFVGFLLSKLGSGVNVAVMF